MQSSPRQPGAQDFGSLRKRRSPRRPLPGLAWLAGLVTLLLLGLLVARCRGDGPAAGNPEAPATPVMLESLGDAGDAEEFGSATIAYTVAAGDTLGSIAASHGSSVEALMRINGLANADAVFIGQVLRLRIEAERDGPDVRLLPDSELVNGPAYRDFDAATFLIAQGGSLASYQELVDGEALSGPQIVARVSREFSVGPRALLAFVEARSGQVSGAGDPTLADYPAGLEDPGRSGLWLQLNWLADRLNGGYYDLKTRGNRVFATREGLHLGAPASLNAGSFAVHRALGFQSTEAELVLRMADFDMAYRRLFGDPWARALPELDLKALSFPDLGLPWAEGERWWMTGGPHGGWGDGSAWAALDFVPPGEERGCFIAPAWATAVADGVLVEGVVGEVWLDLDGDGDRRTGPVVQYLHLSSEERAAPGTRLKAGDPIGHPSCEGGVSFATHLHLSRSYDGEWLAAAGPAPMLLGGWRTWGSGSSYDGGMQHADGRRREACECRLDDFNDVGR